MAELTDFTEYVEALETNTKLIVETGHDRPDQHGLVKLGGWTFQTVTFNGLRVSGPDIIIRGSGPTRDEIDHERKFVIGRNVYISSVDEPKPENIFSLGSLIKVYRVTDLPIHKARR